MNETKKADKEDLKSETRRIRLRALGLAAEQQYREAERNSVALVAYRKLATSRGNAS